MSIITLYNPALVDPDTITNLFLYGSLDTPDTYNSRIRLTDEPIHVQFDMATTAISGPSSSLPPPRNAIIIGGDPTPIDPLAQTVAAFGSSGVDNFDLAGRSKVYAYGGLGGDTIRGGGGADFLWGDIANNLSDGVRDDISGGGDDGDDVLDGGGGQDTIWGVQTGPSSIEVTTRPLSSFETGDAL